MRELNYRGTKWAYYTNKEMKELYPNGKYLILGEISNKVGPCKEMPLADKNGDILYVQPQGTYKQSLYRRVGCMWSEEAEGFISVVYKKTNAIIASSIGVIALLAGLVFGVNYFMNQSSVDPNSAPFESTVKRAPDMDESRILVPGYNDWNMKAGTDEVYVALFNPDENPCYFQFSIALDETKEVLFKTGLVPPGQAVTTVKLPRALAEGVYPVTVTINSFSLQNESEKLNGGEVKTNIIALSE